MKEKDKKFYYIRDYLNHPVVTVCVAVSEDGNISRGVAACSADDNICKKTGRELALARARKALGTQKDGKKGILQNRNLQVSLSVALAVNNIACLSEFAPILTGFEKKLLKMGVMA